MLRVRAAECGPDGVSVTVENLVTAGVYVVRTTQGPDGWATLQCECPDFKFRNRACKHIAMVCLPRKDPSAWRPGTVGLCLDRMQVDRLRAMWGAPPDTCCLCLEDAFLSEPSCRHCRKRTHAGCRTRAITYGHVLCPMCRRRWVGPEPDLADRLKALLL